MKFENKLLFVDHISQKSGVLIFQDMGVASKFLVREGVLKCSREVMNFTEEASDWMSDAPDAPDSGVIRVDLNHEEIGINGSH